MRARCPTVLCCSRSGTLLRGRWRGNDRDRGRDNACGNHPAQGSGDSVRRCLDDNVPVELKHSLCSPRTDRMGFRRALVVSGYWAQNRLFNKECAAVGNVSVWITRACRPSFLTELFRARLLKYGVGNGINIFPRQNSAQPFKSSLRVCGSQ